MKNKYIYTILTSTVLAGNILMNAAQAVPMTYNFETPSFTTISSSLPSGITNFSGTFTVDLAASYQGAGTVTDYFFTDGYSTSDAPFVPLSVNYTSFVTDSSGLLTDFVIEFSWGANRPGYVQTTPQWIQTLISFQDPSTSQVAGNGQNYQWNRYCTRMHRNPGRGCTGIADASVLTDGGSLTRASVPEPSIIALFGLGFVGIGFARRRNAQS
jgi:hypothetical protein